jgi:hypothetical protein
MGVAVKGAVSCAGSHARQPRVRPPAPGRVVGCTGLDRLLHAPCHRVHMQEPAMTRPAGTQ